MKQATEVYINRVNGSPCGEINIHLFKGADSSANQAPCVHLMHYLKGTKAQKERLMQEHREMTTLRGFGQFEMITWYKIFQHSMHLCWYAAISQGVLIQFAVITTLQNSLCGTVEGHVFCTCPCLTLSNLGGKPTVMHVVGSAMDIF